MDALERYGQGQVDDFRELRKNDLDGWVQREQGLGQVDALGRSGVGPGICSREIRGGARCMLQTDQRWGQLDATEKSGVVPGG